MSGRARESAALLPSNGEHFLYRQTVPKNPQATDITYTVQVTSDLSNPASWTTSGTALDQNTASVLQVRDATPVGSVPGKFIRLLISR